MKIPAISGVIDRRILLNYRVAPDVLAALLPAPFRPKTVHGYGMAGICLIRLKQIRPAFVPPWLGMASENAAHRIAVEWDDAGIPRAGVFIPRRDTSSWLNVAAGGRFFPGVHHHARFDVAENGDRWSVSMQSDDGAAALSVCASLTDRLATSSVFQSLEDASAFFQAGSVGYSATAHPARFQGLELFCRTWKVAPLEVERARSSFFEDEGLFPKGSVRFDSALIMRGIPHEWHELSDLSVCTVGSSSLETVPPVVSMA